MCVSPSGRIEKRKPQKVESINTMEKEVDKAKIDVIEKLPPPLNVKGVRNFFGACWVL